MRKGFVAGNWKMNLDLGSARALVSDLRTRLPAAPTVDVAICPPSVYLFPMAKAIADSPIRLGGQNCYFEKSGAFTGELSPQMLKESGCTYVILGHSERRHTIGPECRSGGVHGESDKMIAAKCIAALEAGLTPIVCVGETLAERDANQTESVLSRQLEGGLSGVSVPSADRLVIAYEPVWAIGTGRNATPDQAQDAHRHIRGRLVELLGRGMAGDIRIQYGGSVKPDNAAVLMSCPDVDGALVGGASLKGPDFVAIIEACMRAKGQQG